MWTRDSYYPPHYAHATWKRLAPFFQLTGRVVSLPHTLVVELHPFNDRQLNRDLLALCHQVNQAQLHLPDGRLLVFTMKVSSRPIPYGRQLRIA